MAVPIKPSFVSLEETTAMGHENARQSNDSSHGQTGRVDALPDTEPINPPGSPSWYIRDLEQLRRSYSVAPTDAELARTRTEFRASLEDFFAQVRYIVSLYITVFTLASATVYFALEEGGHSTPLLFVAGGLLILSHFLGAFFTKIIYAMYDLYVSSVLFSQQLHFISGKDTHRWFDTVVERLNEKLEHKEAFVQLWCSLPDSTYRAYVAMIRAIRYVALLVGMILIAFAVAIALVPNTFAI